MPTNNYDNIPAEMREYKSWCLWRYTDVGGVKLSKVPYRADGNKLSVTNPNDWMMFDEAIALSASYDGVGFVFSANDPYAFIDLDGTLDQDDEARQTKIFKEFDSYSEKSPSGTGCHIIIRGSIPQGRRRNSIEIYSSERYATMTGNIWAQRGIAERNDLLNQLYTQMSAPPKLYVTSDINEPQTISDDEVIQQAANAVNGYKFSKLYAGEWQEFYPHIVAAGQGASEAVFALIDILVFYTKNRPQIFRLFYSSVLGNDKKYHERKHLISKLIDRALDHQPPKADIDGLRIALEDYIKAQSQAQPEPEQAIPTVNSIQPPPGLMGEIAQFIYNAAPRPVAEVAITAAIGLMAGICGKAYNFNESGLNLYIMCLAKTGRGKEAAASGVDKIINEVQKQVPVASEFLGPSEIASGQALIKYISSRSQCFVSILGEFGIRLQAMADPRANGAEKTLQKTLLDLYHKSGHGQVMRGSIFADKDKNTMDTMSPAFSILAEGTPKTVYEAADEGMVLSGLLPRFIILDYDGERQLLNKNRSAIPSETLVKNISDLMVMAKTLMANRNVKVVSIDNETELLLEQYDKLTTDKINSKDSHEAVIELWNRAHIKCMRLAALVAIGIDMQNPLITKDCFLWAKNIVESGINTLSKKFATGEVGKSSNEIKQMSEVKRIMLEFVRMKQEKLASYQISEQLYNAKAIPLAFIQRRLLNNTAFKNDRNGSTNSLHRAIKNLLDTDCIEEVSKDVARKLGVKRQCLYMISNIAAFEEEI